MKEQIIQNVQIVDIADKGMSIGKDPEGRVLMVEKLIPGDRADVRVFKKRKGMKYAAPHQMIEWSEHRRDAFCEHFGVCGGCKWQHMDYQAQLHYKEQNVLNAMKRIAKVAIPDIRPILGSESDRYYRNKMEYSFSNKRWLTEDEIMDQDAVLEKNALGFHRPGAFDKVVDIQRCYLQDEFANEIRNAVRDFALENGFTFFDLKAQKGLLRNLLIRNTILGEWMVVVVFFEQKKKEIKEMMEMLHSTFPQINSLQYIVNEKKNDSLFDQEVVCYQGKNHIVEQLGNIKYKISPKSFFQTNSLQAKNLYDITAAFAGLTGRENVYDLYTGTGSIALYLAQNAAQVVGIEEVESAILDAKENMALNDIQNTVFYTGDVKDILTDEFAEKHGAPDVLITDPPRAGMHEKVVHMLLELAAPKVVYVSCNPATQARDIALLGEKYEVRSIQPVDMFPHTHHIENVALLVLKS